MKTITTKIGKISKMNYNDDQIKKEILDVLFNKARYTECINSNKWEKEESDNKVSVYIITELKAVKHDETIDFIKLPEPEKHEYVIE